ncbi:exodeoxyribonuclease V alpha subunit [Lachnospiraceae bacterium PF1-22]
MAIVKGYVKTETCRKEDSGYTIHKISVVGTDDEKIARYIRKEPLTIVGTFLPNIKDVPIIYSGSLIKHPVYGEQFKVATYKEKPEQTEKGIIAYLSSGLIKGIGPALAERIYKKYGNKTLEIMDHDIDKLITVSGISEKKLARIKTSYMESRSARDILALLKPYGVTTAAAMRIFKEFGERSTLLLRTDTFKVCGIDGFGFKTADKLARSMGLDPKNPLRLRKAIEYCLKENQSAGHCGMEKKELTEAIVKALEDRPVPPENINSVIGQMIRDKDLYIANTTDKIGRLEKSLVCLPEVYKTELNLAKSLVEICMVEPPFSITEKEVQAACDDLKITLDKHQFDAVVNSINSSFSIITGGPGTGKTATLNVLLTAYQKKFEKKEKNQEVAIFTKEMKLLSPTGKAARRMTEATEREASTIHSALKISGEEDEIEGSRLTADLIVVDEVSMADVFIAEKLLSSVKQGAQVIFVGDVDQLPSVGAGNVLNDIIESGICPVSMLTKIFRQTGDSLIYVNSRKVKEGNTNLEYGSDYSHIETEEREDAAEAIIETYLSKVKEYGGVDKVGCLIPVRKGLIGVYELNQKLQKAVNPPNALKKEYTYKGTIYREGDLVMQLKNDEGVANGDTGFVVEIGKEEGFDYVDVRFFDEITVRYEGEKLDELTLAYVMTIHKSQGSEYPCVITCFHKSYFFKMLVRNLFYTAITRARQEVITIGNKKTIAMSIKRVDATKRNTLLVDKIIAIKELAIKEMEKVFKN